MTKDNRAIWVTWEKQIRNQSMARELGVTLHELVSEKSRILRYVELSFRTLKILKSEKPNVLFVQNPSIVLSFIAVLARPFFALKVIVDCHNSGLHPLEGRSTILNMIASWIAKSADLTIVSNDALASEVSGKGGRAFVMPDPLPDITTEGKVLDIRNPSALFICTWAQDEPYHKVLDAALALDMTLYVTGNYRKVLTENEVSTLPKNIVLLGFVDRGTYDAYLRNVDLVVDLTTRENCLVCGAYEAVSAGKPMIISNTAVNRKVFNLGAVYAENETRSIRDSFSEAIRKLQNLNDEVAQLRKNRQEDTKQSLEDLRRIVNL